MGPKLAILNPNYFRKFSDESKGFLDYIFTSLAPKMVYAQPCFDN